MTVMQNYKPNLTRVALVGNDDVVAASPVCIRTCDHE